MTRLLLLDDTDVSKTFASHLRRLREAAKLSREALVQQSCVPAATIKKVELTGKISFRQLLLLDIIGSELFRYEIASIVMTRKKLDTMQIMAFFESHIDHIIQYRKPSLIAWGKATELTKAGHPKSGYPSIYGAVYHAMAIESQGVFVTADKCHYEKVRAYGCVIMLENWGHYSKNLNG